ncbi:adenylyltransferase/cytidyltransferase family protein [Acetatifactor muris]|uniref:adenylyltransferase/cytidyltransferase family protein n=1 Tax=Acetatifactor muris TaxID=879566 RepID=UPI0023F37FC4|nr:adenylyltransferase/cytidyltransferase family protein [Acetatifactor muris]
MSQSEELIRDMQKGLLQWYDFTACLSVQDEKREEGKRRAGADGCRPDACILYIGKLQEPLAELFTTHFPQMQTVCASIEETLEENWWQAYGNYFDYLIAIETLEQQSNPEAILRSWKKLLKPSGRMLLGMNNRFGIRYFCGDRDPYTERNFDGIENYRRAYSKKEDIFRGRMYDQEELRQMLTSAGWNSCRFYSVISDLRNPALIYGEDYLPREDLANRVFPVYHNPETIFLEEESLYGSLAENGLFHKMANAWLIECSLDGEHSDVLHVTNSMERGREHALITVIHKSGIVEKRAAYAEGQRRLEKLVEHGRELAGYGVPVVEARMENGVYVMPYIEAEVGQVYLKRLLQTDQEKFLQEMDRFRDLILQSSESVEETEESGKSAEIQEKTGERGKSAEPSKEAREKGNGMEPDRGENQGVILRRGYLDMVPLNSFYIDGQFVFYDQEFCQENYPANAIITRMIATFYAGNVELQKLLPMTALFERYGLTKNLELWRRMEWTFLTELRKEKELRRYHELHRCNGETVNSNRQRMNYSDEAYQRLFIDIFRNADTRKLILFGSGIFAKKFLALYSQDYPVYAIIDNSPEKWGQELEGIPIQSPELLNRLQSGEYKVLICIKNYLSVMKQLDTMGVTEYSIYDSHRDYPRKRKPVVEAGYAEAGSPGIWGKGREPKKYHVGYIAGVFDLFHVGHLNMFRRAKEQCDYLIVGVVSDEGVRKYKEVDPFISFAERIEMVRACRYVDEAVEIPLNYGGTRDAWRLHHFDCQFSGSDYVNNPDWLAEKEFLEKHGAEMVFFPYTETTSSSRIKALIEKKLL